MMYRKEAEIMTYFCTQNFINKFNQLDELYRNNGFKNICPKWGKKISKINTFINALRKATNGKDWSNHMYEMSQYFDLRNIEPTKEQLEFTKTIEELSEMQEVNQDVMKYIYTPRSMGDDDKGYWDLLKKVLVYQTNIFLYYYVTLRKLKRIIV